MQLSDLMDKRQQLRCEDVYRDYRRLYEEPERCRPMIIVNVPIEGMPSWKDRMADPMVMLDGEIKTLLPHLAMGDDRVPTVRVQFGTAQIAAAFGCRMHLFDDNLPCAGSHVMEKAEDVFAMKKPALDAGWYGKLSDWTRRWQAVLPKGFHITHPDIQSTFNSAHLIRGNDILMDFYDHPEALRRLFELVTDYMIDITRAVKHQISEDRDWFFDWGAMWKGTARISNCSMQMISPELYCRDVLPWDTHFLKTIGGGRIHYCGINPEVIGRFFTIDALTGLDVDVNINDFLGLCEKSPASVVVCPTGAFAWDSPVTKRLLAGEWPQKRNIITFFSAPTFEQGQQLLADLRRSIPYSIS